MQVITKRAVTLPQPPAGEISFAGRARYDVPETMANELCLIDAAVKVADIEAGLIDPETLEPIAVVEIVEPVADANAEAPKPSEE